MHEKRVSTGAFVWALQAICELHRIPFSPALALQQVALPYSPVSVQAATEVAGLKSGSGRVLLNELRQLPPRFVATIELSGQPVKLAARLRGMERMIHRLPGILKNRGLKPS